MKWEKQETLEGQEEQRRKKWKEGSVRGAEGGGGAEESAGR